MLNNSVHCCARSFGFELCFAAAAAEIPIKKFTPVRQKRLFGLAFATINFELFVR